MNIKNTGDTKKSPGAFTRPVTFHIRQTINSQRAFFTFSQRPCA